MSMIRSDGKYSDMQERERAKDTLQRGIHMKAGDLDAYIA